MGFSVGRFILTKLVPVPGRDVTSPAIQFVCSVGSLQLSIDRSTSNNHLSERATKEGAAIMVANALSSSSSSNGVTSDAGSCVDMSTSDLQKQLLDGNILAQIKETSKRTGRNVSGRSWKMRPQKRASTLVKTKCNNLASDWEKKNAIKQAKSEAKELQEELKQEKLKAIQLKKERRLENEKRRAENEFKLMQKSVQTLNPNKVGVTMKAMSKKQLRNIKKTRLNTKTGVVEYVSAYAK